MKLSPLDIRKHEFSRSFRGYDPEEVRPFLEMVSQQWEELQDELRHAQDRVREMESKIGHYEKVEEALQEALQSAKANARRTQSHAEERARLILEDAELRAEQVKRDAEQERYRLRQDVSKLTHRHAEVTARLRHFLMSELEILAQHEDERPIGFMKLIPARESEALPSIEQAERSPSEQSPPEPQHEPTGEAEHATSFEASPASSGVEEVARELPDDDAQGTTYADLYARAADRAKAQDADAEHEAAQEEPHEDEDEEPTWTLRSLVSDDESETADESRGERRAEKDHIRRILEDLD